VRRKRCILTGGGTGEISFREPGLQITGNECMGVEVRKPVGPGRKKKGNKSFLGKMESGVCKKTGCADVKNNRQELGRVNRDKKITN